MIEKDLEDKLVTVAGIIPKAYESGISEGKKAEYDAFWDLYQQNGNRRHYAYAFGGYGWNLDTFKPKYPFGKLSSASYMFAVFQNNGNPINLKKVLEDMGIDLDVSSADITNMFSSSDVEVVPTISRLNYVTVPIFLGRMVKTVEKLILKEDGSNRFVNAFQYAIALENLTIEGTIGQNGFDVSYSTKLSKASHESIVTHLSTTASGMSAKFSQTAINKAFETSAGANDGFTNQASGWYTLIAKRSNWTFEYGA